MTNDHSKPTNWQRGFWCLMATQFQGAFSDNVLRWFVIYLVIAKKLPKEQLDSLVADSGMYFAIPFLVLSMFGGWMADRFSKQRVMAWVKLLEVVIMVFAIWALGSGKTSLQLTAICLMGAQSAFFGASKYGSLPEIVPTERLSWANGIIEMLTFLAAILGTVFGAWLATRLVDAPSMAGWILLGLAVAGWLTSLGITKVKPADPTKPLRLNFLGELWREFAWMKPIRDLWRANLGNTGFFFVAALLQMNIVLFAEQILKLGVTESSSLQVALALGMAAGSLLAGKLSGDHVEYGLIPIGAILMASMAVILGIPGIERLPFTIALSLLGVGGGLFIVPIAAVLQHVPPAERKGSVQGAAGWLSWVGIALAAVVQKSLTKTLGFTPEQVFWFCAVFALATGIYVALTRQSAFKEMIRRWSQGRIN
jgi:acyl-[acyl-carrier-protein]-phospholipid O-acyltransferase / long-chain-fatty-acid--[acyl-carrier-protein] ligase